MNKEEFDVLVNDILKVPMEEPPVSAYGSININELRQVIEAFNKIPNYDELIKDNCKKDKEIERLNNIINELEKWLKEETIDLYDKDNPMLLDDTYIKYATERKMAYMYVLDKLKELKENK